MVLGRFGVDPGLPSAKLRLMFVIVDLCLVPIGVGVSVSSYVAECHRVLKAAGIQAELHSFGSTFEGEWDQVMAAVKACHEAVHGLGAPRIVSTIKLGTRTDREQTMADKLASVQQKLEASPKTSA